MPQSVLQTRRVMRPKFKDNPREWQKFAAIALCLLAGGAVLLWRRARISGVVLQGSLAIQASFLVLALFRPRAFRPLYLASMRFSHAMGSIVGRLLLIVCFILVLTPLGLLLRLLGHDLLQLRQPAGPTYWRPTRRCHRHDRSF